MELIGRLTMTYITYKEAADKFGVTRKSISDWVKKGQLTEGPMRGKAKTITLESVEQKLNDDDFIQGLQIARGTRLVKKEPSAEADKLKEEIKIWIDEGLKKIRLELLQEIAEIKTTLRVIADQKELSTFQSKTEKPSSSLPINETLQIEQKIQKIAPQKPQAKKSSQKKKANPTQLSANLEDKVQLILKVSDLAGEHYGRNQPNPFSLANIDPKGKNITSILKKGKRPENRINYTYNKILEINKKEKAFSVLSFNKIQLQ